MTLDPEIDPTALPPDVPELELTRGGPAHRIFRRLAGVSGEADGTGRRIAWAVALTWLPLFALAAFEGRLWADAPREAFLYDIATWARFLVVVPVLIFAERIVGARFKMAALQFLRGGYVTADDRLGYDAAVARAHRGRDSWRAELVLGVLASVLAWKTVETWYGAAETTSWHTLTQDGELSLAALWYSVGAVPILHFLWLRWIWRLGLWGRFLRDMTRLRLELVPTHPDQAGGMGFLGNCHGSLGVLAFCVGCVPAADAAFRIVFEAAKVTEFRAPFLALLFTAETIFLAPLLVFVPRLFRAKKDAQRRYNALVAHYGRSFDAKWARGALPAGEPLLGSADIQSLADIGNSFGFLRQMRSLPFGQGLVIQLALAAAIPAAPLIFLVMPLQEILKVVAGAIF